MTPTDKQRDENFEQKMKAIEDEQNEKAIVEFVKSWSESQKPVHLKSMRKDLDEILRNIRSSGYKEGLDFGLNVARRVQEESSARVVEVLEELKTRSVYMNERDFVYTSVIDAAIAKEKEGI